MKTVTNYLLILSLLTVTSRSWGHHSHSRYLREASDFEPSIGEEGHEHRPEDEPEVGKDFGTNNNNESPLRKPFWNSFRLSRQFSANRSLFFKPKTRPPVIISPSLDLRKKSSRSRPYLQVKKEKYRHETVNSTSTTTRLSPTTVDNQENRQNQLTKFTTISPLITPLTTRSAAIASTTILTITSTKSSPLTSDMSAESLEKKSTTASTPAPTTTSIQITTSQATQSAETVSMTTPTPMTKLLATGTVLKPITESIMLEETEAPVESTTGLFTGSLLTLNDPIDLF